VPPAGSTVRRASITVPTATVIGRWTSASVRTTIGGCPPCGKDGTADGDEGELAGKEGTADGDEPELADVVGAVVVDVVALDPLTLVFSCDDWTSSPGRVVAAPTADPPVALQADTDAVVSKPPNANHTLRCAR
jgi:hypothetical protein